MTGDFNIKNNDWNLLYPHYSIHTDTLREIADSFCYKSKILEWINEKNLVLG